MGWADEQAPPRDPYNTDNRTIPPATGPCGREDNLMGWLTPGRLAAAVMVVCLLLDVVLRLAN